MSDSQATLGRMNDKNVEIQYISAAHFAQYASRNSIPLWKKNVLSMMYYVKH